PPRLAPQPEPPSPTRRTCRLWRMYPERAAGQPRAALAATCTTGSTTQWFPVGPVAALGAVAVHELSRTDARRIAVRAQLPDSPRPAALRDAVRHLTLLPVTRSRT